MPPLVQRPSARSSHTSSPPTTAPSPALTRSSPAMTRSSPAMTRFLPAAIRQGNGCCRGHIQWTNAMSTFVLTYLSELVRNGNRTNFVCKQVHLNACAKALNGSLGCQVSGTQVSNHLRKWKKLYKKMKRLQNISAALWDEDTCTITLDAGHYQEYIKDHKDDANFLNKPWEHYREMETIFNNAMATGKYAKGSSETLGTDFINLEKVEASNGAANE